MINYKNEDVDFFFVGRILVDEDKEVDQLMSLLKIEEEFLSLDQELKLEFECFLKLFEKGIIDYVVWILDKEFLFVNCRDSDGYILFYRVCYNGCMNVVKVLL